MRLSVIDAHIHLDDYVKKDRDQILERMQEDRIWAMIAVSNHLVSAKETYKMAQAHPNIYPAFGYHPEQQLPSQTEKDQLFSWIKKHQREMIAIGEVGLPYYRRQKNHKIPIEPYVELLEAFVEKAMLLKKPIILHAVYEDAPVALDLLEKYSIEKAHFHWFKGDKKTIERMIENQYFISVTPDLLYKDRSKQLIQLYPLTQIMVETDGPWKFAGPFKGKMTQPSMLHEVLKKIAQIKNISKKEAYTTILANTKRFYGLDSF